LVEDMKKGQPKVNFGSEEEMHSEIAKDQTLKHQYLMVTTL